MKRDLLVFIVRSPSEMEYFYIITESLDVAKIKAVKFITGESYFRSKYEFFKRITWNYLEIDGWKILQLNNIKYEGSYDVIKPELFLPDELKI